MIDYIKCANFKVLRNANLQLGPFTLVIGPNGSGKSTLLQAITAAAWLLNPKAPPQSSASAQLQYPSLRSMGSVDDVTIELGWNMHEQMGATLLKWDSGGRVSRKHQAREGATLTPNFHQVFDIDAELGKLRFFGLVESEIWTAAPIHQGATLLPTGAGLAAVLDRLRDQHHERLEALNDEVCRWLPEYDRILFDVPSNQQGHKTVALRTKEGGYKIPAHQLSQGTLFSLALLTLAYLPDPPPFIAIEEIDRGIHPRLLNDLLSALYRLSFPDDFGDDRPAVQVVATTHSPYLLDLFKDHPEYVVVAHKKGINARLERLSDREDFEEISGSAPLGQVWYSGVLGGVPGE